MALAPSMRVCPSCGLGLLLKTRTELAPGPNDAFMVVDSTLAIEAVSERAERLLDVSEQDVVHRPLHELLRVAGIDGNGRHELAGAVINAAAGVDRLTSLFIRRSDTYGVRMRARIGACGPPRAALIVFETARPELRSVRPG
jgi:PAS domain-containing protein